MTGLAELPDTAGAETLWQDRYAQRTRGMAGSPIRDLLKLLEDPAIVSFAGGLPAPEALPRAEVAAAAQRVMEEHGGTALQYGPTEGYRPLREMLVRHMSRYGIQVGVDNVLVTTGSQQALDLVGKLLINPGDRVATEAPTYLGALQAWNGYQAEYLPVPMDDDGMRVNALEDVLRAAPKFLYVLPNFQNPSGVTLSLQRRRQIVEMAARYGTPIVEDDPYGQLRYEGRHLPPLVVVDARMRRSAGAGPYRGAVVYLGTLSKILGPGLRIGWVVAPEEVIAKLAQMKQGVDLHTSTFAQMVAYETARGGFLDRHVLRVRKVYRERRDAMLSALARHFPPGVRWTRPEGGLFLWVTLPEGCDSGALLKEALLAKVAFIPGRAFHPDGGGVNTLRLNFSYCGPAVIEQGIERLGRVLWRAVLGRTGPRWAAAAAR
jgi:2-aminoadipate transaminase